MGLISVDLPAPLSPTTASTSPAWRSRSTPRNASTGPKLLRRSETCRTGDTPFPPATQPMNSVFYLCFLYIKISLLYIKCRADEDCQPALLTPFENSGLVPDQALPVSARRDPAQEREGAGER